MPRILSTDSAIDFLHRMEKLIALLSFIIGPAVLSTAVIARCSSAPRLQTYKAEDEISVGGEHTITL